MAGLPTYIRFVEWAEARSEPFTFGDVELAMRVTREGAVALVLLALENGRVEQVDNTSYHSARRGFPSRQK